MSRQYAEAVDPQALDALGRELSVTAGSLQRLGIGWAEQWSCWTFPLRDAAGRVVGINRRFKDNSKRMITGGKVGLYLPEGMSCGDRFIVTEGASDAAAILDLGFTAVGRFSCNTCSCQVVELIRKLPPDELVVVADHDKPGQRGAESLVTAALPYVPKVRVITPPDGLKDARAWRQAGATHHDALQVISAAAVRRLSVHRKAQGVTHGQ